MSLPKNSQSQITPYIIWLSLVVFFIYQFIARSSFPTNFLEKYMQYFSIDAQQNGILGSSYYVIYTLMQIPAGIIVDRYSIRYIATISTALCAIGLALFVSTTNFYFACFSQMIVGFASTFAFVSAIKAVTLWFPAEKRAILTSYTISMGCMGPVIFGPSVAHIAKYFYWKNIILVFAGIGIALAVIIWFVVKDKDSPTDSSNNGNPKEDVPILPTIKLLLKSPQIWILSLLTLAQYAPLSALGDMWGMEFIKIAYNAEGTVASSANNMLYTGLLVGSPVFVCIATKWGSYKKAIILGIVMCTLSFGIIEFCNGLSLNAVFVLMLIVGFSTGAMLAYQVGTMTYPSHMSGVVVSIINMASMMSGVILMPTVGALVKLSWDGTIRNGVEIYSMADYKFGFSSVLLTLVFGMIFAFFVKDYRQTAADPADGASKR